MAVQPRKNHLTGVQLIGVYLMGVHLIDVYFINVYMFPNPKRLWGNLQIPHLINGGRFVEIRVVKYESPYLVEAAIPTLALDGCRHFDL
jgi:hypothetical protein